ncbi:hypothetical protein BDF22DRAFT_676886, partial [Syncephalis plumigaleata]
MNMWNIGAMLYSLTFVTLAYKPANSLVDIYPTIEGFRPMIRNAIRQGNPMQKLKDTLFASIGGGYQPDCTYYNRHFITCMLMATVPSNSNENILVFKLNRYDHPFISEQAQKLAMALTVMPLQEIERDPEATTAMNVFFQQRMIDLINYLLPIDFDKVPTPNEYVRQKEARAKVESNWNDLNKKPSIKALYKSFRH